jgi:hypothetical protein
MVGYFVLSFKILLLINVNININENNL